MIDINITIPEPDVLTKGETPISNLVSLQSCRIAMDDNNFNFISTIPAVSPRFYKVLKDRQEKQIVEFVEGVICEWFGMEE